MNKLGHSEMTAASNAMNTVIDHLERAASHSGDYAALYKSAKSLKERMYKKWTAGVNKGRKEGWFK